MATDPYLGAYKPTKKEIQIYLANKLVEFHDYVFDNCSNNEPFTFTLATATYTLMQSSLFMQSNLGTYPHESTSSRLLRLFRRFGLTKSHYKEAVKFHNDLY